MAARKKTAKKAPGETQAATVKRLSKALGGAVTRHMVRVWTQKGLPLQDPAALAAVLLSQRKCPPWLLEAQMPAGDQEEPAAPATVAELQYQLLLERVRKTAAEATIKELDAQAAKEKWFTAEQAHESGRQIGAVIRSHLLQIPNQWTPILQGLPAGKMREKMRREVGRILGDCERMMLEKGAPPE